MNVLASMSHRFYSPEDKDPTGTGNDEHKYTQVLAFAGTSNFVLHTRDSFTFSTLRIIYSVSTFHVYSMMFQLFFVSRMPGNRGY